VEANRREAEIAAAQLSQYSDDRSAGACREVIKNLPDADPLTRHLFLDFSPSRGLDCIFSGFAGASFGRLFLRPKRKELEL